MIGQEISHYKVVEKLGAGGMGDVYRAHDSKLGRDVALKVLPADMAESPERRKRFEREARAVAALKHPNIVTIHSVEEANGTHFITMELVEGQTLSAMIPRNGLTLEQFLDWGVSLADAIASAHEKGITHRDLKPANVMFDADGRLKVLDFGLAKLLHPEVNKGDDRTLADSDTAEGMVMGTVAYMSPEQAEGREVDPRSDIFSLGVMLYEMATGTRPFNGDTRISTISSILRDEPAPVTEIKHTLPRHLGRIVKRCLAKDAKRRYQSALDLRNDLEQLKEEVESGETLVTGEMAAVRRPARRPAWMIPVVTIAVVAVAGIALVLMRGGGEPGEVTRAPSGTLEMTPITTNGRSSEATISADGRYVCYTVQDDRRRQSLLVSQVATGSAVEIVPAKDEFFIWDPTFSPDGDFVYFISQEARGAVPQLNRIPVLGGAIQKIKEDVNGRPSFSPDGSEFIFLRSTPESESIVIAGTSGGGEERVVGTRKFPTTYNDPVWSPDGKTIAVAVQDYTRGIKASIMAIPATGGEESVIATDERWTNVDEMSWLPDGRGIVADVEQSHMATHIWEIPFPAGEPRKITTDLNQYHGVEITGDGSTLVTQQVEVRRNLFTLDADGKNLKQLTNVSRGFGADEFDWVPDGRIVYQSNLGGNWDLWIMNGDGSGKRRLTSDVGVNVLPSVSPDGSEIVFVSDRSGSIEIWKMGVDGGNAKQLTTSDISLNPEWATDGIIVFQGAGVEPGQLFVYKMTPSGGSPEVLSEKFGGGFEASPDGHKLLYSAYYPEDRKNRIDVIDIATGETERSLDIEGIEEFTWSPDGKSIHYSKHSDGQDDVWIQPIEGGEPTQMTHFDSDDILGLRWSREGKTLALTRGDVTRDIVLLKNFR